MSYPNYGGGYPPQQPGYGPAPGGFQGAPAPGYPNPTGYPPAPGGGMPTPESASAAAYGSAPGLPYAPQPGGPGNIGFNTGPPMPSMPQGPGGYPPAPQPGYPQQPGGYPPAPQPMQPGYNPAPGGYGAPPYGQPQGAPYGGPPQQPGGYMPPGGGPNPPPPASYAPPAGGYGAPQQAAAGYGAPQQPAGGYGAPQQPAGGYGAPQQPAGGYGAPQQPAGGYGAPQQPAGGYGAPQQPAGGYGAPQQPYGGHGKGQMAQGGQNMKCEGTVRPIANFNPEQDAQHLRKAMKGFGTDEKAIIDILSKRSNDQRVNLKLMYKTCFGRDLVADLKSELSGNFEDAIVALLMTSSEYDAAEMRYAMQGAGTKESTLIEILCTRSNKEISAMKEAYKRMYRNDLEKAIMSETSGHFRKLMVSMCAGGRQEQQPLDMNKAATDAQRLYQAGVKRWGTDENTFNMILASQSHAQCRAVFQEYIKIAGQDIETSIKREMSGDFEDGMLTIVRVIRNRHEYFADRLHHSMQGLGTHDRDLIRVIVSRCEVDLRQIKMEYQRKYGKGLEASISGDVSGDYKRLLLSIVAQ